MLQILSLIPTKARMSSVIGEMLMGPTSKSQTAELRKHHQQLSKNWTRCGFFVLFFLFFIFFKIITLSIYTTLYGVGFKARLWSSLSIWSDSCAVVRISSNDLIGWQTFIIKRKKIFESNTSSLHQRFSCHILSSPCT